MKLLAAIIKPSRLDAVRNALSAKDIHGMTVTEVRGYGRQKGHTEIYRGAEYAVNFIPKLKVEVALTDDQLADVIDLITEAARSGRIGDGKIFVFDLLDAIRIRTGERAIEAL
ncbi:P-II family nitrogen regulator [Maritalea porphyrae]|jgi:nitrogen regulatory protein P-II 2|uniref:P-II family nitrogen regulator n=1 Tax=Maritalea porphyrae TaxID=880732 RepID=UPI0022AFFA50|nr:P-II family nitrogen regulator [Maritalea porphyrae]MCZ4272274.1 P-II family nitrogen regulator [Maritalea porphyrae]